MISHTHTRYIANGGLWCLSTWLLLSPIQPQNGQCVNDGAVKRLIELLHDGMTECIYQHPITSFTVETKPQPVFEVDILGGGRAALEAANEELGETCFIQTEGDYSLYTVVVQPLSNVSPLLLTLLFSRADICEYTVFAA